MAVEIPSYATSPFFITAGMLMPPWADPNAVMKFSNYLVGMGLKMGAAPKPSAKSLKALKAKGVKINPHMSLSKGLKNANKHAGKAAKVRMNKVGGALAETKLGKLTRKTGRGVGSAGKFVGEKTGISKGIGKIKKSKMFKKGEKAKAKSDLHEMKKAHKKMERATKAKEEHIAESKIARAKAKAASDKVEKLDKKLKEVKQSPQERAALEKQLEEAQDTQRAETNVADSHDAEVKELNETIGKNNTIKQIG